MNVEYSKRALADLHRIAEYHVAAGDAHVAEAIGDALQQAVARLTRYPQSGRPVRQRSGVRVVLVHRYRYKIFYRAGSSTIRIVHIRHTSRRAWR
jgi:plasmid stabilization system protein ParE